MPCRQGKNFYQFRTSWKLTFALKLCAAVKVDPHTQRVPRSQRGGEVIEPLVSSQWFVKTEGMGSKALKAVEDGDIKIVPERFNKIWYNWLSEIRDW